MKQYNENGFEVERGSATEENVENVGGSHYTL